MLRSLDYYMLVCMIFVFGALVEAALVGMTDYRSADEFREDVGLPTKKRGMKTNEESKGMMDYNVELRERPTKKTIFQEVHCSIK